MLAEDTRPRGRRQRTFFFTAIAEPECEHVGLLPEPRFSQGPVGRASWQWICNGLPYRRGTLRLGNSDFSWWAVSPPEGVTSILLDSSIVANSSTGRHCLCLPKLSTLPTSLKREKESLEWKQAAPLLTRRALLRQVTRTPFALSLHWFPALPSSTECTPEIHPECLRWR